MGVPPLSVGGVQEIVIDVSLDVKWKGVPGVVGIVAAITEIMLEGADFPTILIAVTLNS
jgi:hypothetical protein